MSLAQKNKNGQYINVIESFERVVIILLPPTFTNIDLMKFSSDKKYLMYFIFQLVVLYIGS